MIYKHAKSEMLELLKAEPRSRERSLKDFGIRLLLANKYPELKEIDKHVLVKVFKDYATYDRIWRKCLEENESLQGSDYSEKQHLMSEAKKNIYQLN